VSKKTAAALGRRGGRGTKFALDKQNYPHNEPRHRLQPRRWATSGGNRLTRLQVLLIAEARHVCALDADNPRRKPTLPRITWLGEAEGPP
jgi:hypothetical protein